jgi:hypothetical protein
MNESNRMTELVEYEIPLNDEDMIKIAENLGEYDSEIQRIKDGLTKAMNEAKARIKDFELKIGELAREAREGVRHDMVECDVVINWDTGKVEYHISETGVCIKERDITIAERQLKAFKEERDE